MGKKYVNRLPSPGYCNPFNSNPTALHSVLSSNFFSTVDAARTCTGVYSLLSTLGAVLGVRERGHATGDEGLQHFLQLPLDAGLGPGAVCRRAGGAFEKQGPHLDGRDGQVTQSPRAGRLFSTINTVLFPFQSMIGYAYARG